MGEVIDRRAGFTYAGDFRPGSVHRIYDLFNTGLLGHVGDTIIWASPHGDVYGEVVETGWQDVPNPTRWADARVASGNA